MPVILTEEQKNSPLYKYYELPIDPVPKERFDEIMKMDVDNPNGMDIADINQLFDDGYQPSEFGLFETPDGGWMAANLTDMPGVTAEMFDWWFAWHGLDTMRYIIWDKDDHYYCQTQNPDISLDDTLAMKERYQNTTHDVKEGLMDGDDPIPVKIEFVPPETIGFDPEKVKAFKGTIVCTPGPVIMIHFLRPTENGSELRTRFFMGYKATPDGIVRVSDRPKNAMMGRALLIHNIKEFTHLAKILPDLYREYKDDFTIGLK